MSETITVNCPTCGKTVVWGEISLFRPFCSKRCQLIDLENGLLKKNESPAVAIFPKAMTGAKNQSSDICLIWMRRWHLIKRASVASGIICKCRMQRNALSGIHTLKFRNYRFIGWRKIIGIKTDQRHPLTGLPFFTPRLLFPAFDQPKPQSYMPVREFIFQFFK